MSPLYLNIAGTVVFTPVFGIGYTLELGIGAGLSPFEFGANLGATGVLDRETEDRIKECVRRKISN